MLTHGYHSAVHRQHPRHSINKRRFAGAIGPHKRRDLSALKGKVNVINGVHTAELFYQLFCRKRLHIYNLNFPNNPCGR